MITVRRSAAARRSGRPPASCPRGIGSRPGRVFVELERRIVVGPELLVGGFHADQLGTDQLGGRQLPRRRPKALQRLAI